MKEQGPNPQQQQKTEAERLSAERLQNFQRVWIKSSQLKKLREGETITAGVVKDEGRAELISGDWVVLVDDDMKETEALILEVTTLGRNRGLKIKVYLPR